ncbi:MAG: hypothetical protein Q4C66_10200 [Lachnospiraceae bacterium]|nr:hypothetical protein [Lachnospiraceae bacterium]
MMNRNIIIAAALSAVVITGAVVAVACSSRETPEPIDLSTIHTTSADSGSAQTAPPQTTEAPVEVTLESPGESLAAASKGESISYEISLYTDTSNNISIRYPTISNMSDKTKQEEINQLLKDNALAVLKTFSEDSGSLTLDISCQVPSISRKRITAVYTGTASVEKAAHPVNLFYTNTVDLTSGKDLGFSDYTDPYTMAGYLLSDDVQFDGLSGDRLSGALAERTAMDIEFYTHMFQHADFPLDPDGTWPSSFSYEKQGEIYFSIPVSHALGDYVIVKFTPETK